MSILLLPDDTRETATLASVLEDAGFPVNVAASSVGPELIDAAAFEIVAMIVDGQLEDRTSRCRRLRAEGYLGAIMALGAEADDIPTLLDAGFDDFVLAPTRGPELVARVRMALGRVAAGARRRLGPLEVDRVHRTASLRAQRLSLTDREYALLACLVEAGGDVVSRTDLLSKVWAGKEKGETNVVEVHLSRLRGKLGDDAGMIETVRRAGYRLRKDWPPAPA